MAAWLGAVLLAVGAPSWAGTANDVPSCIAANRLKVPAPPPATEVFFLIDETTPLDDALKAAVRENAERLVQPGHAYVVAAFSSFGQGRYLRVLSAGVLEAPLEASVREDIPVKTLRSFDACMAGQARFGRQAAARALNEALAASTEGLARSDVMAALKALSARVAQSAARDKVVLVVSDMLEHSAVSSFYAARNVRELTPAVELRKAEQTDLLGRFGGARVYVLGGGLVQDQRGARHRDSGVYRSPTTIGPLREFWRQYFARSGATLVEFGAPALLSPVR